MKTRPDKVTMGEERNTNSNVPRAGVLVAAIGGGLLILSEIVEVAGGGFSNSSFAVTITAFFTLAAGIWGLHVGQAPWGGRLSLTGAALFSAGTDQPRQRAARSSLRGDGLTSKVGRTGRTVR